MRARHLFGSLTLFALALLSLGATCNTPPPAPPGPDASDAVAPPGPPVVDAAPTPPQDASPAPVADSGPQTPCGLACAALAGAGCPLGGASDCATFMTRDLGSGKVENKATHRPLTCPDVAAVRVKSDAQKLGFVCP